MPGRRWTSRISFLKSTDRVTLSIGIHTVSDRKAIFKVNLGAQGATLVRIKRGRSGYRKAKKNAIMRQRDSIELFRKLKKAGKGFTGTHAFHFVETARTFAMLCLQARLRGLQDNMDQILAYDGSSKRSDR